MDKGFNVIERLEYYAEQGRALNELNLYDGQIAYLSKNGFTVQKMYPIAGWKGQFHCRISCMHSAPGTLAFSMLKIAAQKNPELEDVQSSAQEKI